MDLSIPNGTEGRASAVIPEGATAWYLNIIDGRGLVVSTPHEEAPGL